MNSIRTKMTLLLLCEAGEKNLDSYCAEPGELWEKVDVARGMTAYDRENDLTVGDVARRADKLMYENKFETKGLKRAATA